MWRDSLTKIQVWIWKSGLNNFRSR